MTNLCAYANKQAYPLWTDAINIIKQEKIQNVFPHSGWHCISVSGCFAPHEANHCTWHSKSSIHSQPLVYAVNGGLHVVQVFGQAADCLLQLFDLLTVTLRQLEMDAQYERGNVDFNS